MELSVANVDIIYSIIKPKRSFLKYVTIAHVCVHVLVFTAVITPTMYTAQCQIYIDVQLCIFLVDRFDILV